VFYIWQQGKRANYIRPVVSVWPKFEFFACCLFLDNCFSVDEQNERFCNIFNSVKIAHL